MQLHRGTELALATIIAVFAIMVAGAYATDYFVAKTGDNSDGLSWGTAWNTIQQGVDPCSGSSADVVKVGKGTYVENIVLKSYVTLEGGWDPTTDTRDHDAYVTAIDGGGVGSVVTIYTDKLYVTIDGFTITNGSAASGGGICIHTYSSATITNNTITGNEASADGGGISCYNYCSAIIRDNMITDNSCPGGYGGGISCHTYSSPTLQDNVIMGNSAGYGGGISCYNYCSPTIINCLITHNTASSNGGGIYCHTYASSPTLTNCTISDNESAGTGGGFYVYDEYCKPTLVNCIVWGNSPDEIAGATAYVTVTYSDVAGGWTGTGNIDQYPQFRWRGGYTEGDGYFLDQKGTDKSPCIDTGNTSENPYGGTSNSKYTTDVGGHLDMTGTGWDDEVDMGYHYPLGTYTYIELVSFAARPVGSRIVLDWETGAEIDNAGFVVYRAIAGTSDYQQLSGLIPAQGTPSSGASYSFTDSDVEPGVSYNYWLVDIDTSGKWTAHGPASARLPLSIKPIQLPTANCQLPTANCQPFDRRDDNEDE
ncbi:MAG TPA: right-handed parallel beta-helix repeat-containing protein [bacterium]|nr:right-handed parallel beta-helix repeat-containing protein [bacterium]